MMTELGVRQVSVNDPFWSPRLEMNARQAILHQWEQLERTGCIDNFRIVAEGKEGFREGWFFADSDAFKWLDAACRVYAVQPYPELETRIDALIDLLARTQTADGYLYTYNQIHFAGQRWVNLQIEHELYCHGHLIEAGVSHFEATGERRLLDVAERAAGLMVRELSNVGPAWTDGHEEIELALIKLFRVTGNESYLDLASRFLERRGRIPHFWRLILEQNRSAGQRREQVKKQRDAYLASHSGYAPFKLPPANVSKATRGGRLRYRLNALSGKMLQQHRPIREQTEPVGHAVRFAYLETAVAMLYRERRDDTLLAALEKTWERMVRRRMYVTGGLGALPEIEGFGRDFELEPEAAYAETCAALGSIFWNWEMLQATRQARYADLLEWQLYNAASVGMGREGTSYLYNNPLSCHGGITRREWFEVPCCPSNLSRTWASLGRYLFSCEGKELWVHQYVGCQVTVDLGSSVHLEVESGLPWQGKACIRVEPEAPAEFTLHARIPSWSHAYRVRVNGQSVEPLPLPDDRRTPIQTASGYAPHGAFYVPLHRTWSRGDIVELELPMPIAIRRAHRRVRGGRGQVALTRGPLVYCLESVDNPGLDLFQAKVDLTTLRAEPSPGPQESGWVIHGRTAAGQEITAIPYYAWANRGESQMTVMIRAAQ